ncbi:MAG: hypothetical protein DWH79_05745 [Planctomycetota bacterium]|nr:MAG: hypothetical protein DWH79_05745 [Planctomycetota bacterium]
MKPGPTSRFSAGADIACRFSGTLCGTFVWTMLAVALCLIGGWRDASSSTLHAVADFQGSSAPAE